ncbi:MAG TPA: TonB family protein [Candidatus Didemnitutus sp.]|nr:TonB family protein [Candidatus Didemnitutus sp.]
MTNRILLVLAGALLAAGPATAEIRVKYTRKGISREVAGYIDGKLMARSATGLEELPAGGTFSFEGDQWSLDEQMLMTPRVEIERVARPDRLDSGPRSYRIGIFVRNGGYNFPEANKTIRERTFQRLYHVPDNVRTLGLFVWLADGAAPEVGVRVIPAGNKQWYQIEYFLHCGEDRIRGRALSLILGPDGIVKPAPEFELAEARTALRFLADSDARSLAELLRTHPAIAKAKSYNSASLLHFAALMDRPWAVPMLEAAGVELNGEDDSGDTPLVIAARMGRDDFVTALTSAGASRREGSPMVVAARFGHTNVVRALLAAKVGINLTDETHKSAVDAAIDGDYGDIVELLASKGADENLERVQAARVLLSKAQHGQTRSVRYLIARGVEPDVKEQNLSPVLLAASQGDAETVACLVKAKVNVNYVGQNGLTPLLAAGRAGSVATIEILWQAGGNPHARTKSDHSLLECAAESGNAEALEYLIARLPDDWVGRRQKIMRQALLVGESRPAALVLAAHGATLDPADPDFVEELESVLRLDLVEYLDPLLKTGWSPTITLHGAWPLAQVASQFDASRCVALLAGTKAAEVPSVKLCPSSAVSRPPAIQHSVAVMDPRPDADDLPPGSTTVTFVVDRAGEVRFPRVISTNDERLRGPSIRIIGHFHFRPAESVDGPVNILVSQELGWGQPSKQTFSVKELDVPPQLLKSVVPVYPSEAKRRGLTGSVELRYIVDTQGRVRDAWAVQDPGAGFERAAVEAVKQWTFQPGLKNGHPVNTMVQQELRFNLE